MASQYLNGLNGVHSTQSIWQATPEMTQVAYHSPAIHQLCTLLR